MLKKIRQLLADRERLHELLLYLIFGGLTTLVSWGVYYLWRQAIGLEDYAVDSATYTLVANIGQILAFVLSVAFAFVTNKRYVFKSDRRAENGLWKEMGLFASSRVASYLLFDVLLFNILLHFFKGTLPDADLWIKLAMNALVVIFNYVASKLVIFRKVKE